LSAACGGGDEMPDAPEDIGFNTPTVTLKANRPIDDDNDPETEPVWEELGDADLTCLNTPNNDMASTVVVTLSTKVNDFQTGNSVPGAMVTAFKDQDFMNPFDTQTADGMANITFTIPVGTKRFGYRMSADTAMPTFLLNQTLDTPDGQLQMEDEIQTVSKTTAATLSALIGKTRTLGTGVVAGALRDCQNREISGFIATMSSTSGSAATISGSDTYYFSPEVGLPVHHNRQHYASSDGLFMIIEIPGGTPTGYVQMWGFPTSQDMGMGADGLKLIAELKVPVLADTVITGSYDPLRN
jgi:hypothetical protein